MLTSKQVKILKALVQEFSAGLKEKPKLSGDPEKWPCFPSLVGMACESHPKYFEFATWREVIATSPIAACSRAIYLKARIPEFESVIKEDSLAAYLYAACVMGRRWPDAEEVIKQDPRLWTSYERIFTCK